ncbi:MAG: BrnT family toxin [Chloroflexi bacterium]|nr:BrnT family toxin [Chloroflexota bacterium]
MEGFEWDAGKAQANVRAHGVTFAEAATVFDDPLAICVDDEAHSGDEQRYVITGQSALGRVLTVAYTMRGDDTRIITARVASARELREYAGQLDQ